MSPPHKLWPAKTLECRGAVCVSLRLRWLARTAFFVAVLFFRRLGALVCVRQHAHRTADEKIWCFTHPGLTCGIPLEPHYFKHVWPAKKKGGRPMLTSAHGTCSVTRGSRVAEFEMDPKGEKPKYLPLCGGCRLAGRAAVTAKEYKLKKGTFDSIFE